MYFLFSSFLFVLWFYNIVEDLVLNRGVQFGLFHARLCFLMIKFPIFVYCIPYFLATVIFVELYTIRFIALLLLPLFGL